MPCSWQDAWGAAAILDRAAGFRKASETAVDFAAPRFQLQMGGAQEPLRVLLAARESHRMQGTGDRLIVNQAELVAACGRAEVLVAGRAVPLQCRLMPAGLGMEQQAEMMQWAEVYACMWGGDSIHALHLRRGAIVIEMINQKFRQTGPWAWVGQHRRWVMKQRTGAPALRCAALA